MIQLTPEQREQIFREEFDRRSGHTNTSEGLMAVMALIAAAGLAGLVYLGTLPEKAVSLDALRRAYAGLDIEEDDPENM